MKGQFCSGNSRPANYRKKYCRYKSWWFLIKHKVQSVHTWCRESELNTGNLCVTDRPHVVTDSAPYFTQAVLHSALKEISTTVFKRVTQTNVSIITHTYVCSIVYHVSTLHNLTWLASNVKSTQLDEIWDWVNAWQLCRSKWQVYLFCARYWT